MNFEAREALEATLDGVCAYEGDLTFHTDDAAIVEVVRGWACRRGLPVETDPPSMDLPIDGLSKIWASQFTRVRHGRHGVHVITCYHTIRDGIPWVHEVTTRRFAARSYR